jgi:apolipoprotein N-acyltransferase
MTVKNLLKCVNVMRDLIRHLGYSTYGKCIMLIIAGMISIYAFAPYNVTLCTIIPFLVLFTIDFPKNNKQLFAWCLLYGYSYFVIQIYWIFYFLYYVINAGFFVTSLAVILFPLYLGLYPALALFSFNKLKTNSTLFNYLLLFPSLWVLFEWIRGFVLGGYSWSNIGLVGVNYHFLLGYFPIIGEYGVSWVIISLIAALYLILKRLFTHKTSNPPKMEYRLTVIYLAVFIIIGTSLENVHYTKAYGNPISVALIQGNIGEGTKWTDSTSLSVYSAAVKNTKADIIMMPETGISQFEASLPHGYLNTLESYAKSNNAALIIGLPVIIDKQNNYVNAAMLLTNPGRPFYAKRHLVPYGEYIPAKWILGPLYQLINLPMVGFSPGGDKQPLLLAANQKLAFNICYENGFGSELIEDAKKSTLMVNLSDMVWYGTTVAMDQHLELSRARALENQRYFIQETNTSITAIITPDGQIQSRLPVFRREVLKDSVQGMIGVTPYQRFGNWVIVLWCILISCIGLILKKFLL